MPRRRTKGFIRPRDPYQQWESRSNRTTLGWRRLKDCFTGRGSDIFVGDIFDSQLPARAAWSLWGEDNLRHSPPEFGADRHPDDRYDFRTRKYQRWAPDLWSDLEYCRGDRYPQPRLWRDGLYRDYRVGLPPLAYWRHQYGMYPPYYDGGRWV